MLTLKKKGNRYYREDRFSLRSFPIKKTEAEKMLTEGKAELTDFFIWEIREQIEAEQPQKPSNILSITERIKQKQEDEKVNNAVIKFKEEYLPNLTKQDIESILNSDDVGETMVKICWRIDLERKLK